MMKKKAPGGINIGLTSAGYALLTVNFQERKIYSGFSGLVVIPELRIGFIFDVGYLQLTSFLQNT
jgi:hypothetical protein